MIPDPEFIKKSDIPGPTKEEIRCLVICKSKVTSKDTVVDIGCGTGGLTLEFARRAEEVYAVDKNPEAIKLTGENLKKQNLTGKVQLIQGKAPEVFKNIPHYNILMVGGSSGNLPLILEEGYKNLKIGGKIIVTSILLETRLEAVHSLKELGMEPDVVEVYIAKGHHLDRGTMMLAQNPVVIISGEKNG